MVRKFFCKWILRIILPTVIFCHAVCEAGTVYSFGGDCCVAIRPEAGTFSEVAVDIADDHLIADVDVRVTIRDSRIFELQLFLKSPAGTTVPLNFYNFDEFFVGGDYIGTVFDDEADVSISEAEAPFTGRFKVKSPWELGAFDGENTKGKWTLRVYNGGPYNTGAIEHFELMITNPEPATLMLLAVGTVLGCWRFNGKYEKACYER